jgi:small subunit ribosomal protein S6
LTPYETTVVIDSTLKADDIRNLRDKITNFISNHGGSITKIDEWGKRRLAYEIKKKQYGYYINIQFSAPAAVPGLLEREYRLNESVLRYLTAKIDKRALKSAQEKARIAATAADESEEWDAIPVRAEEDLEEESVTPEK